MCWCNNKKKIFYIFFIKETVTRSCSARVTFVLRLLHVRATLSETACFDKLLCFYYLFQALVMFPEVKCYVIICSKKALFSDK